MHRRPVSARLPRLTPRLPTLDSFRHRATLRRLFRNRERRVCGPHRLLTLDFPGIRRTCLFVWKPTPCESYLPSCWVANVSRVALRRSVMLTQRRTHLSVSGLFLRQKVVASRYPCRFRVLYINSSGMSKEKARLENRAYRLIGFHRLG